MHAYIFDIFTALCILKISSGNLLPADITLPPFYIKKKKSMNCTLKKHNISKLSITLGP